MHSILGVKRPLEKGTGGEPALYCRIKNCLKGASCQKSDILMIVVCTIFLEFGIWKWICIAAVLLY